MWKIYRNNIKPKVLEIKKICIVSYMSRLNKVIAIKLAEPPQCLAGLSDLGSSLPHQTAWVGLVLLSPAVYLIYLWSLWPCRVRMLTMVKLDCYGSALEPAKVLQMCSEHLLISALIKLSISFATSLMFKPHDLLLMEGCLWSYCNGETSWNYLWREGNFFLVLGFYLVTIWHKLLKAT